MATPSASASASPDGAHEGRVAAGTAYDAPLPSFEAPPPDTDLTVPRLPSTSPPPPRGGSEPRLGTARAQSTAAPEVSGSTLWASAPMWLANAGEAVRGALPLALRDRLHAFPGAKVFALSAGVGVAFFGAFATTGALAYRALKTSDTASATTSATPPAETPSPTADTAAGTVTATPAPAQAVAAPADEPKVLLDLAESLLAQHRDGDVPSLLGRLIVRRPELKDDERLKRLLLSAAASDDRRASSEAHALLTGPMGETGAALVYELSLKPDVRDPVRLRAQNWLTSKDFERNAALPVYAAAKLRSAKTCEDKHALLDFAGAVGGKYVLSYLHELEGQTSCKPEDLVHCQPCLRNDSRLSDTIAKLEHPSR
jgi:hypothetical protein